jgi:hypothetical protein
MDKQAPVNWSGNPCVTVRLWIPYIIRLTPERSVSERAVHGALEHLPGISEVVLHVEEADSVAGYVILRNLVGGVTEHVSSFSGHVVEVEDKIADGKDPQGRWHCVNLPREQWAILIKDAHPGYISWAEFEGNQKRLEHNHQARAIERQSGPPREGPALLQGLSSVASAAAGWRSVITSAVAAWAPTTFAKNSP